MTGIQEYAHSTNYYRKRNTAIAGANMYRAKKYINIITYSSFLFYFSLIT